MSLTIVAPLPFRYVRPESVDEALIAMSAPEALALAGGTDLVTLRADGVLVPESLVDIKAISELRGVGGETSHLIGATTTMRALGDARGHGFDAVVDGANLVGGAQTRARATLGGNIVRSSPAGDTLCGLLVLDARLHLRSVGGDRVVPIGEFFTGPGRNIRRADELLTGVEIATHVSGSCYQRFTYRNAMDLAVVGVGVSLVRTAGVCSAASVAIGAVGPVPLMVPEAGEALIGSPCDGHAIDGACAALLQAAAPIDDVRGTRRHRLRVLPVLARRVIEQAWKRTAGAAG